jgi:hypothetical protein
MKYDTELRRFLPGPREAAIYPALVHVRPEGGVERCPAPDNCEECAPKVLQRRAFSQLSGEDRERMLDALAEARMLDDAEAREHARIRAEHQGVRADRARPFWPLA